MKKNAIERIVASLQKEKKELTAKLHQGNHEVDVDGDEIDEIQGNLIASISSQLSSRDNQKLVQIEQALTKIKNNSFGLCEDCEEAISDKRLEINPYFATCISCAEQREFDLKQRKRF